MEIKFLAFSIILGIFQLFAAAHAMTWQRGAMWNLGKRDEPVKPLTGIPGRLDRALNNFKETFPFFAVAVILVVLTQKTTENTALGAQIYFYSRLIYIPLYVFGVIYVRSAIWIASIVGIGMVLYPLIQ